MNAQPSEVSIGRGLADVRAACRACPIVVDEFHSDLVEPLLAEVVARATAYRSAPTLNVGGWRSDDLALWGDRVADDFREALRERVEWGELTTWAMVNRAGSHHPRHRHDGGVVSGIYYLDPGDEPSAPTVFELGPRGRLGLKQVRGTRNPEVEVAAAAARLVLFPGDMWHRVPPYVGERPRVTVAFDVRR